MLSSETKAQIRVLCAKGYKATQIARMTGVGLKTVYRHTGNLLKQRSAAAHRQTVERNKAIFRRVYRGATTAQVGREYGLTQRWVAAIVRRYATNGYVQKPGCRWQNNPNRRLSIEDGVEIISLKGKESALSLAIRFKVTRSFIYSIWHRRRWAAAWEVYDAQSTETNSG